MLSLLHQFGSEIVNDNRELNSLEMSLLYKKLPDEVKDIAVNPYLSIEIMRQELMFEYLILIKTSDDQNLLIPLDLILLDPYLESDDIVTGIMILYNNIFKFI